MHLSAQDIKYSSSTIQADLDRFQRQKVADLREMAISMARSHRDWCQKVCYSPGLLSHKRTLLTCLKNLEAWEEAKREVEKIPDHPNKAPPTPAGEQKAMSSPGPESPSARRNSSATVSGR